MSPAGDKGSISQPLDILETQPGRVSFILIGLVTVKWRSCSRCDDDEELLLNCVVMFIIPRCDQFSASYNIQVFLFSLLPQQPLVISQWEALTAHSPPIRGPGHIWQPKRLWAGRGLRCHMCTGQPPISDGAEWGETEPELSSPHPVSTAHLLTSVGGGGENRTSWVSHHTWKPDSVHYLGEYIFR